MLAKFNEQLVARNFKIRRQNHYIQVSHSKAVKNAFMNLNQRYPRLLAGRVTLTVVPARQIFPHQIGIRRP